MTPERWRQITAKAWLPATVVTWVTESLGTRQLTGAHGRRPRAATANALAPQNQQPSNNRNFATLPQPKDTSKRPELTPGPRQLTKQEESFVRDNRARYIAQATNDINTFMKYLADEYFGYEALTGELRTRETWRQELSGWPLANVVQFRHPAEGRSQDSPVARSVPVAERGRSNSPNWCCTDKGRRTPV